MRRRAVVVLAVLACVVAGPRAQTELEGFIGTYDPGSTLTGADFNNGSMFGFRLGRSARFLGGEFSYTFMNDVQEKVKSFQGAAHLLSANMVVHAPFGRFVPYGSMGIGGLLSGDRSPQLALPNKFAWNVGGGVKLRYLANHLGLRFDVRFYKVSDGIELPGPSLLLRKEDFTLAAATWGVLFSF